GNYAEGAQPRLSLAGSFRYVVNPRWRWQVSPYFTWNAYRTGSTLPFVDMNFPTERTKDFMLTQLAGANAQVQFTRTRGATVWHAGGGPAVYRVVLQNHRKVLKDPLTDRLHQGTYIGATGEVGVEHFLHSLTTTSLEWTAAYQWAYARRDDQFLSGFDANPGAFEIRFGGHYYFDFKAPKPQVGLPKRKR
ncbi:MAG TPA: hypothetical protein VLV15_07260, partial [Dongiaceae bacterium]|nr:hypothetical protein [Dongiaceae bacterium]